MRPPHNPQDLPDLLGHHLGLADEQRFDRLEAEFGGPKGLTQARARLQRLMSRLDDDAVNAPPDLVGRVLQAVEAARNTIPFDPAARPLPVEVEARGGGAALLTLREVVGLAAAILVFVGIFVPGYHTAQRAAQRTACMNNVRTVGAGYANYIAANSDYLPFAGPTAPGAYWLRTDEVGVPRMSNSRHLFKLTRGGYIRPADVICPSREGDYPLDVADIKQYDDYPDPRNNSFSTNIVLEPHRRSAFQPDMPMIADNNPMIEAGRLIPGVRPGANSRSHVSPSGQNVLLRDLSAVWSRTPRAGIDQDDIYHIAGVENYRGFEKPRSQTDAFLIP